MREGSLLTVCLFAALLALLPSVALAQRPPISAIDLSYLEFDFIRPGARPAALGGAFIAAALDEMSAFINPAGLTYLKRPTVSAQLRFFQWNDRWGFANEDFDQYTVGVILPVKKFSTAYSRHYLLNEKVGFITQQFLTIDSPLSSRQILGGLGNFPGKEVFLHFECIRDNFSIAYEFSKRLSLGATLQLFSMRIELSDRTFLDPLVTNVLAPRANSEDTAYSLSSANWRLGGYFAPSFGVLANVISDKLFVGAVANVGVTFNLGTLTYLKNYRVDSQNFPDDFQFQPFNLTIPDSYGLGVYYRARNRLSLSFDVFRIEYSDMLSGNDLNIVVDDDLNPVTRTYDDPDGQPDLTVADATEFHFGLEWLAKVSKLGLLVPLRLGLYTDPGHRIHSVSDNPDLKMLYPAADDRLHFTFGSGFLFKYGKFDTAVDLSDDYNQLFFSWTLTLP